MPASFVAPARLLLAAGLVLTGCSKSQRGPESQPPSGTAPPAKGDPEPVDQSKKVIGILRTDAAIMGNSDPLARVQKPAWAIVRELTKRYEVRGLDPSADIPADVDVLLVPQLPSLSQADLDNLRDYIAAGRPALITADPLPVFDVRLAPKEDRPRPWAHGGEQDGDAPSEPKGDYTGLLRDLGVTWIDDHILNVSDHTHADLEGTSLQIFLTARRDRTMPFKVRNDAFSGLEEVVVVFGGELSKVPSAATEFTPLLVTGRQAGYLRYEDMVVHHPLFGPELNVLSKAAPPSGTHHVIGARIAGGSLGDAANPLDVVVLADLDFIEDLFFLPLEWRDDNGERIPDLHFNNASFILNVIDSLAGDDRFIERRKSQPAPRKPIAEGGDASKRPRRGV